MMQPDRIQMLKEMLDKEPSDEFLNYALALEFEKLNDFPGAVAQLKKVLSINAGYYAAYYQLGKIYEQTNEINSAIECYLKGREIAKSKNEMKAFGEFNEALLMLDYEE